MRSIGFRRTSTVLAGVALLACTGACTGSPPIDGDEGRTTTTYGNTMGSGADSADSADSTTDEPDPDPTGPVPTGPDPDTGIPDIPDGEPPNPGGAPDGASCTSDEECASLQCYVIPFLGGTCGECNQDADCDGGGCTQPNPFDSTPSYCNDGGLGAGCESDDVCSPYLSCSTAFNLLGLIELRTCGLCQSDAECGGFLCAPVVELFEWTAHLDCIPPNSLPQDSYCDLQGAAGQVCETGICSTIDIMGLAEIGACGECDSNADCPGGTCIAGEFILDSGTLIGSRCM